MDGYLRGQQNRIRMYGLMLNIHSVTRWVILILIVWTIVRSIMRLRTNQPYEAMDKRLGLLSMIFLHTQFILGLGLYFSSPFVKAAHADMATAMKDSVLRFWAVEHITGMILAVVLVTIGYSLTKRATSDQAKFKKTLSFYIIGIILILATIPWPFLEKGLGRGWF